MTIMLGKVVNGRIEVDAELPEGAEVEGRIPRLTSSTSPSRKMRSSRQQWRKRTEAKACRGKRFCANCVSIAKTSYARDGDAESTI